MALALFDLDNTLIDRSGAFRRWAVGLTEAYGLGSDEVGWLLEADGDGAASRSQFLAAIRERYGIDVPLSAYQTGLVEEVEVDPLVPVALDRLRGIGWRVAIITNGRTAQQSAKIRHAGLDAHVDAVAISEEVGEAKPSRLIFEVAAQRAGLRLSNGGWMVGDSAEADIVGGRAAGLTTVWMHLGRDWDQRIARPDFLANDIPGAVAQILSPWPPTAP